MNKKKIIIVIVVLLTLLVSLILFFVSIGKKGEKKVVSREKVAVADNSKLIEYDFFYQSSKGNYLIPMKKKINKNSDIKEQLKEVVIKLFEGIGSDKRYINLFSSKIKLNNIFVVDNKIVVIDINHEIYTNLLGGSIDEILTVYSIVDTICFNFPYIKGVQILIDGRQTETLSGHIDISRPIRMDSRWIRSI